MNLFDFSETAPELEPGQVSGIRLWAPSRSMDEIAGVSGKRDLSGMDAIARGEFVPNPKIGAPSFSANVGGGILSGVAGMLGAASKIGSYVNPGRYIDALTGENFFAAKAGAEYGESLKPEFEEIGRRTGAYEPESVGATVGEIAPSLAIPGGGFLRAVKGAKELSTAKKLADVAIGGALGGAVGGAAESGTEGVLPGAGIGAAGGVAVGGALMGASRLLKGKPVEEIISSAITPLQKTREGKVIRPQSKINEQIRTTTQDIVARGDKPTNLAEYEQSVRKGMNEIYTKHITPAVDTSKSVVDLRGIAGKIRSMAEKEGLEEVIAPGQVQRIEALADFLEKKGNVSLPEAERIKQYVNANADFGVFGQERLLNNALKSLTSELGTKMDEALGSIGGKQASEWKKLYGAYSELLYDISKASIKYERQPQVGFFEGLGRLGGAGDIVSGIFTADPKQVLRGLSTVVQGKIIRELNDKNNLVRKAFEKAAKEIPTPRVAPASNVKTKMVDVTELAPTPPVRQSSVSVERPNRRRPGGTETTRRLTRGMEGQRPGKEVVTKQRLGERRQAREGAFQKGEEAVTEKVNKVSKLNTGEEITLVRGTGKPMDTATASYTQAYWDGLYLADDTKIADYYWPKKEFVKIKNSDMFDVETEFLKPSEVAKIVSEAQKKTWRKATVSGKMTYDRLRRDIYGETGLDDQEVSKLINAELKKRWIKWIRYDIGRVNDDLSWNAFVIFK